MILNPKMTLEPSSFEVYLNRTESPSSFIPESFSPTDFGEDDKNATIDYENNYTGLTIDEYLSRTLSDYDSLETAGSPQNSALAIILNTSSELDPSFTEDRLEILQRYALNTLYFSTNGKFWKNNSGWTSASHPCGSEEGNNTAIDVNNVTMSDNSWFGISCNSDRYVVEKLSLDSNNLRGMLTSEIQGLVGLHELELPNNKLSGYIPRTIGNITGLSAIDVKTNFFTGTIPSTVGMLTALTHIEMSQNFLSGSMESQLGRLSLLRRLSVASNFFAGSLPSTLFSLSSLSKN